MSYAALGAECVGMDVISDPITGLCHCPEGMVRLGTLTAGAGSVANDCVDPDQFKPVATTLPEVVISGAAPRPGGRVVVVTTGAHQPVQLGMLAGWAAILGIGGYGASLIWKATHRGRS
jgi:hypothetical protein